MINLSKKPHKKNNPLKKTGRRSKQTFLRRRYTNSQQTHEKMLNTANQKNTNQNYNEVLPHTSHSEWPSLKSLQITNAGEGVEKREPWYIVG